MRNDPNGTTVLRIRIRGARSKGKSLVRRPARAPSVPAGRGTTGRGTIPRCPSRHCANRAASHAPLQSVTFGGSDLAGFDDLLTSRDLGGGLTGNGSEGASVAIPRAPKKKKRSKAFYWAPGISAIGAAVLNILIFLGCLGVVVWTMIALVQAEVEGAGLLLYPIIRLCIFGFFVGGGNIHAVVAGLNLVTMRGRTASAVAIGELFFTPIAFAIFFGLRLGWIAAAIFGIGMALYNWPIAGWVAIAISGKQAKIDFDEFEGDELEKMAEELQNRAASKKSH